MPPRASSVRRQPRVPNQEPENPPSTRSALSPFQKPNLPALRGTPSSRRQYSYGAAAEPLPSRPGRGLQRGQVLDLSNAVRNALIRQDQDELHEAPSISRAQSESVDPDEDELVGASEAAFSEPGAQAPTPTYPGLSTGRLTAGSEVDDNRSFAMESDYYGDATIASSPGSLPPRPAIRALGSTDLALTGLQSRNTSSLHHERLRGPVHDDLLNSRNKPGTYDLRSLTTKTQTSAPPATEFQGYIDLADEDEASTEDEEDSTEDEEGSTEDEKGQLPEPISLGRGERTNTPAPRGMQTGAKNTSAIGKVRAGPASPPESEDRIQHPSSTSAAQVLKPLREHPDRQGAGEDSSVVNHAEKAGPGDNNNEGNPETGRWINDATKATTVSDIYSNQEHDSPRFLGHGDDRPISTGLEDPPAIDWWQLLNPWTYVKATAWVVEDMGQRLLDLYSSIVSVDLRRLVVSATQVLPRIVTGVLGFVLVLALLSAGMAKFKADPVDDMWSSVAGSPPWYSVGGIARKIGGSLPALSWSSRNRWDSIVDSWEMDDPRHLQIDDYLKKIEQAFRQFVEAGRLHDASLEKLEAVVPKVVHMRLKDGKPVVAPEFWHALRDLIREDGSFLTFDRKGGDYEMSSERQWKAIATRLVRDPAFANKLNVSIGKVESKMDGRLTLWETWVRENDAKIKESLGSAMDQLKFAGSQREWEERLGKTVEQQIREYEHRGRFVGRDEYLRLVQKEVASHHSEFRAELAELQPQLEKFVRKSIDLAKGDTPLGMSGAEITALVNGLVRKAFADINLEALAKGKIHANWDMELRNQVNYFSPAAGAAVDVKHSSATYDPFSKAYLTLQSHRMGLRARLSPIAALQPWHDDGDCWCAARSQNHRGNPHGASLAVLLAYRVVPQYLVVEHILPGATTEPGARPREIELYASIDDVVVRERVRDFAAAHLPTSASGEDSVDGWNYMPADLPDRFVIIGRLVYAGAELHGGVHVHRLSSELVALGADTDHVVVRAVSNHGADNHTCFYRVRLYGHNVELCDGDDELAETQ